MNRRGSFGIVGRAGIEEIVVHISRHHNELIDEADQKRLVVSCPRNRHRFLQQVIAHAMRNERDFRFAGLLWVAAGFDGVLLFFYQPIEKLRENAGEVFGTRPSLSAVRFITDDGTERRPIVTDPKPEAIGTIEEFAAKTLIKRGGTFEADIEAVDEDRDMTLLFVLALSERWESIGGTCQQCAELRRANPPPIVDAVQRSAIADEIRQSSDIPACASASVVAVADEPVFRHGWASLFDDANGPEIGKESPTPT